MLFGIPISFANQIHMVPLPIPLTDLIVPLIIWLANLDRPFVVAHGKECLNFHISITLYIGISIALCIGLIFLAFGGLYLQSNAVEAGARGAGIGLFYAMLVILICFLSFCTVVALALISFIATIQAAFHANKGEFYRYPFTIRLLK